MVEKKNSRILYHTGNVCRYPGASCAELSAAASV